MAPRLLVENQLIDRHLVDYDEAGSSKANGRVPKTCLGLIFNYNLGCFDDMQVLIYVDMHPYL